MEPDSTYFARRADEEQAAAAYAEHPKAQQVHLDLASRYQELADAITAREHHIGLHLVTDPSAPLTA